MHGQHAIVIKLNQVYAGILALLAGGGSGNLLLIPKEADGGYDPRRYTGFAFGMGPQRQTMLLHRMNDIRYFWGNDIRFLEQF